ncbi:hypothetical protein ACIHFD_49170 [Nonomuraea sp. NPDC051941]|uniref:hypothetical protein n=1 Tax=Nonomuraea sp. NPDC051941 TaxID=3364373 RepID=UPI0037C76710
MDLDAARRARAERKGIKPEPVTIGGEVIAVLPVEMPLDVLGPLVQDVNVDIALLFRNVVDVIRGENADQSTAALLDMAIDLIVLNPKLPAELLEAGKEILRRLLGQGGYDAFVGERPSREDVAELVKGLFGKYGWSLGESSASETSSDDGTTSTPTGPTTTPDSTSTESGTGQETPLSSGFADSLPSPSDSTTTGS